MHETQTYSFRSLIFQQTINTSPDSNSSRAAQIKSSSKPSTDSPPSKGHNPHSIDKAKATQEQSNIMPQAASLSALLCIVRGRVAWRDQPE
jgi:hypothetical protein